MRSQFKLGTVFLYSPGQDLVRSDPPDVQGIRLDRITLLRGLACLVARLIGLGIVVGVAAGCGGGPEPAPLQTSVTGLIQEVEPRSLLEIGSLTVVDGSGTVWMFKGGDRASAGFSPSHLRDHMLSGLPVRVTYHREDGSLVIDDITD